MNHISRSTARRLIEPRIAALVLAALRLRLHLEPTPRLALRKAR